MSSILDDLNDPQREAVIHRDGPLLVLAGAGSGKTRVITRRVAYLIQQGVDPRDVLAITFTNKAAEEMRRRVEALNVPRGSTVCTFHSLCARLLREFAPEANLDANYTIYDRDDQLKVVKKAVQDLHLSGTYLTPTRVHARISCAKNGLQTAEAYARNAGEFFDRQVAKVYQRYEAILVENNALDFDDLLLRMAFLLRDRQDIRDALGRRYAYVLVDEYQDTNHAQYILAHEIARDHGNLCVTGDPDQSIYAWRGADIHNILEFEQDHPGARVIRLEENYRSFQPILTAAGNLIEHNTFRKSKRLFTRKPGGEPVCVLLVDDEHAEARHVARRIEDYRVAGGRYDDVAIFYRVNSLSRVMEEALMRAGVPYRIARGVEFYRRKEIKDVLAYLRLLLNPADDLSCARVINTPARGIGASTIGRLGIFAAGRRIGLLEAARCAEEAGLGAAATKKLRAFADMMAPLAANLHRPVRELLEDVLRRTGLEELFSRDDEDSRQAGANVAELVTSAAEFDEEDHEFPLAEYLQQVSLVSDVDHMEGAPRAVTLMTLHAAKGLEFPVVYILGCEEGLLPWVRAGNGTAEDGENLRDMEEERRLAFVGMTRAMNQLTLTSARTRRVRGREEPQAASKFLSEIGEETVRREDLTTDLSPAPKHKRRGGFVSGADERSAIEAFVDAEERAVRKTITAEELCGNDGEGDAPFPPEYEHLRPGCRVSHARFGIGKVVKLSQRWPDTRAEVVFRDVGPKKLVLRSTHLEILDDPYP